MALRIIHETDMTPAEDAAIKSLLCASFPHDTHIFSKTRAYNGSGPAYSVVLEEDGQIIAHLGVVDRTISVGANPLRAAGIQNVAVSPPHRGQNLTAQTMARAMREATRQHFDTGLLFCVEGLEKLYSRLGWFRLANSPITRIHEARVCPLPEKNLAMFYPLRQSAFPLGPIHLQGDDW